MESKNSFDLDDLTEEQYHEIKEAFDSFDRDGRQALQFTDVKIIMIDLGISMTDEELNRKIVQIDSNGDGAITFEEFIALVKEKLASVIPPQEEVMNAFRLVDCRNTGYIEYAELTKICTLLRMDFNDDEIRLMIHKASRGTGKVSYKEFRQMVLN